jgi:redox-sensing transcriptional repressor
MTDRRPADPRQPQSQRREPASGARTRRIPEATVARLPLYLRILSELADDGVDSLSSDDLAGHAGMNAAKVRKDLSYLGSYGTRGVGYEVAYLVYQIRRELGLTHDWPIVIVGAGNLGQALANYGGFAERGFVVAGVVDIDHAKVGSVVGGVRVRHADDLDQIVHAKNLSIGIIATPGAAAQDAADRLVRAGITSILNFAPSVLSVPRGVTVRKVDLASELQILSYYEQRRATTPLSVVASSEGGRPATA